MAETSGDILSLFLNELEAIHLRFPEVTDTDVRESIHGTLAYYFVWGHAVDRLPCNYGMFTPEGDELVSKAVASFWARANESAVVRDVPVGKPRLDLLQDPTVTSSAGRQYDDLLGHVPKPLPDEPLPEFYFIKQQQLG